MRSEYALPNTNSPPAQPSTWQLRFGKKSATYQYEAKPEVDAGLSLEDQARSPSISDKLLRALDTKPSEQEELSRECVDELIGRRNAFASEPEWRLRALAKDTEDGDIVSQEKYGNEDIAAEAKEIIRARFQIENQASAMRQEPKHRKPSTRRTENKNPHRGVSTTRPTVSSTCTNNTCVKLNHTTPSQHEKKDIQAHLKPSERGNQKTEVRPAKTVSRLQREQQQLKLDTTTSRKKPRSYPKQLPMERRHQLRNQAREARRAHAAEERAMQKLLVPVTVDNNKDEIQEQRRIEEEIERLTSENQQAAALEERLQQRKARLKSLGKVFDVWNKYVESKREHETRVAVEFDWRVMKRIVTCWKRYTHRQSQARAVEQARLKLVREHQMNDQARQFCRLKRLPTWFYRWTAFVMQQKDRRAAAEAAEGRKAQSQRLIERLQRQKTLDEPQSCCNDEEILEPLGIEKSDTHLETMAECNPTTRGRTTTRNSTKTSEGNHQETRKLHAWTDTGEPRSIRSDGSKHATSTSTESPVEMPPPPQLSRTSLPKAPMRVDKVYKAMEQRAVERKRRREELKRRYEELEQKKREEQEEQRVAREALLVEQQMEEKARIRERKLAEALALKEKHERREHLLAQWDKAKKHNRRRLLYYYALLPWRKHQILNERVARNATRWHKLRTMYSHWEQWQEYVQMCRKVHRRRERARLEEAARYYARSLQRRALRGLMRFHKRIQARALSVHRQRQWNTLQRSWTNWRKSLAKERAYQRKLLYKAVAKMQQTKLRQICERWREVVIEATLRKELECEKQQLWRKVRGWLDEDDVHA